MKSLRGNSSEMADLVNLDMTPTPNTSGIEVVDFRPMNASKMLDDIVASSTSSLFPSWSGSMTSTQPGGGQQAEVIPPIDVCGGSMPSFSESFSGCGKVNNKRPASLSILPEAKLSSKNEMDHILPKFVDVSENLQMVDDDILEIGEDDIDIAAVPPPPPAPPPVPPVPPVQPIRLCPIAPSSSNLNPVRILPDLSSSRPPNPMTSSSSSSSVVRLLPSHSNFFDNSMMMQQQQQQQQQPKSASDCEYPNNPPRTVYVKPQVQNPPQPQQQHLPSLDKRIAVVTCYKCTLCGFLAVSSRGVSEHIEEIHGDDPRRDHLHLTGKEKWLQIAKEKKILLECEKCENKFNAQGSRSYKVHMIDDHGLGDEEAAAKYEEAFQKTKKLALEALRARRRKNNDLNDGDKPALEAYLDEKGQLKIRQAQEPKPSTAEEVIKRSRGRPKGSRTVGIAKLKKSNPGLEFSSDSLCAIDGCGVRLVDPDTLDYHRRSHGQNDSFNCLECDETFRASQGWSGIAMHLWRSHKVDMELLCCDQCQFRAYSKSKLDVHKQSHGEERPYLCDDCGKNFKTAKSHKSHRLLFHSKSKSGNDDEDEGEAKCELCERSFRERRRLKLHVESVHKKLRPFLCSICGHGSSTKSNLKLHMRKHSNDKPYICEYCEFRSADHNSFRRHLLRHTGKKPYKCPHCPYEAIQSSSFKLHLKNKHPDKNSSNELVFKCDVCPFQTVQKALLFTHSHKHVAGKKKKA